ncbi:uncharacterized protein LOC143294267 [Babylonia areolata]|uniref:uncharacterized protein LOC143294267 n=1 Tax=Babylonia areolata TaxID=304850 RepID=UPI003FD0B0FE
MDIRERLIVEVKKYPALYDRSNEDYKKYEQRVQIWTAIGRKFSLSASEAQAKWKNLRDNMVKHIKRNSLNKDGRKKVKQYKFAKMLEFVIPFLEISRTNEPAEDASGLDMDCQDEGGSYVKGNAASCDDRALPEEENSYNGNNVGRTHSPLPSSSFSHSISLPVPPSKKKKYFMPNLDHVDFEFDPPRQKIESVDQEDDIGLFLSSMAGSIRKLPFDGQARVRFSIHKIVHDAELEYLYPRMKEDMN